MTYTFEKQYEGLYHVLDEDGDRVARVGRFMPGPMVSVTGPQITPPAMARAIAQAMTALADEIEQTDELQREAAREVLTVAEARGFVREPTVGGPEEYERHLLQDAAEARAWLARGANLEEM